MSGSISRQATPQSPSTAMANSLTLGRMLRPGPGAVVFLTDSIGVWNGDGTNLRQRVTFPQQVCARSGQRMKFGGVFGTAGFSMIQCRDVWLPQILALNPRPSACWIEAGTNILTDVRTEFKSLDDICNQLLAAGIVPILQTILPRNDSADVNTQKWNATLRRYAEKRGFILFDASPALTSATGAWASSLYVDNIHPDWPGHTAIAKKAIADNLHTNWPQNRVTSKVSGQSISGDAFNLLDAARGLFVSDSNADGLANGWTASGTNLTYSLVAPVAADNLIGNWQRVVRTTGGATGTVYQAAVSGSSGYWAPGDTIAYCGRFRSTVAGTGSTYTAQVTWTGSATHNLEPMFTWDVDIADGTFYGEAVIPAGTTALNAQISLSVPTSGSSTLDIGELTLWNISRANALMP